MKLSFSLLSLALAVAGCSSSTVKSTSDRSPQSQKAAPVEKLEAKPMAQAKSYKCEDVKPEATVSDIHNSILGCVKNGDWSKVEKLSLTYQEKSPQSAVGLYYGSVAAENLKKLDKALWLIDLAIRKDATQSVLFYQKGRVLVLKNEMTEAQKTFSEASTKRGQIPELVLSQGIIAYNQKNCGQALEHFSKLGKESLSDQDVVIAYTECLAEKTKVDFAISFLKEKMKSDSKNYNYWLHMARLQEVYNKGYGEAMKSFEEAGKLTTEGDVRTWIKQKIEFLQKQIQVSKNDPNRGVRP